MKKQIHKFALLLLIVYLLFAPAVTAENITFRQAVEYGIQNNYELEQINNKLKSLQRNIDALKASLEWQVNINSSYSYGNSELQNYNLNNDCNSTAKISMEGSKRGFEGVTIKSRLALTETYSSILDSTENKYDINLSVNKLLYPAVPTEVEKNYLSIKNEITAERCRQNKLKGEKKIAWMKEYYQILRLKERLQLKEEKKVLAQKYLETVKKEKEIGEAGKNELLMALINVKEAEMNYINIKFNYEQAVRNLQQELGLSDDKNIIFTVSDYSSNFLRKAKKYSKEFFNNDTKIIKLINENNDELKGIKLDIQYNIEKYSWQKAEDMLQITAQTNYNKSYGSSQDYWDIGLNFSYNLFDGGQQELALTEIQSELNNKKEQYKEKLRGLKNELKRMYEQININKTALITAELKMQKRELEKEMYREQYDNGLINKYRYKQELIKYRQSLIDYKSARDELIFSKIQLLNFIGI